MNKYTEINPRYSRQTRLKNFSEQGQQKLLCASVLVVGAGGLGCAALPYLVAAGVGKIGIADDDVVALHNLHRQVLYTTADVGLPKAQKAAERLRQLNPDVDIGVFPFRLTAQNALGTVREYDLVLDATDNFTARYIINDACVLLNKPFIYGAISEFEGQVAVFNAGDKAANYRDLFPQPPQPGSVLSCAEAGVLGVLPGIIGTMQAAEAIKMITGMSKPLVNQLFAYNALTNTSFVYAITAREETSSLLPKTAAEFEQTNYEWLCNGSATEEIDGITFSHFLQNRTATIVDVREAGESPVIEEFLHQQLPLSSFRQNVSAVKGDTVILFCQSGKRSAEAARILTEVFGESKKVYSLKGGIGQWKQQHGKGS